MPIRPTAGLPVHAAVALAALAVVGALCPVALGLSAMPGALPVGRHRQQVPAWGSDQGAERASPEGSGAGGDQPPQAGRGQTRPGWAGAAKRTEQAPIPAPARARSALRSAQFTR